MLMTVCLTIIAREFSTVQTEIWVAYRRDYIFEITSFFFEATRSMIKEL